MDSNDLGIDGSNVETDLKLRERYLLERDRIKAQIGDLKQILEVLGVNQRRACQLLLVDPSAWTRWNKTEAPPHIYQALKWLVMLKTTNPSLVGSTDIENRIDLVQSSTQNKLKELERSMASLERVFAQQSIPAFGTGDTTPFAELFRSQEERLQKRISELEMEVKRLLLTKQKDDRSVPGLVKNKKLGKKKLNFKTKIPAKPRRLKTKPKKKPSHKKKIFSKPKQSKMKLRIKPKKKSHKKLSKTKKRSK